MELGESMQLRSSKQTREPTEVARPMRDAVSSFFTKYDTPLVLVASTLALVGFFGGAMALQNGIKGSMELRPGARTHLSITVDNALMNESRYFGFQVLAVTSDSVDMQTVSGDKETQLTVPLNGSVKLNGLKLTTDSKAGRVDICGGSGCWF